MSKIKTSQNKKSYQKKTIILLSVLLLCFTVLFVSCGGGSDTPATSSTTTSTSTSTNTTTTTTTTTTSTEQKQGETETATVNSDSTNASSTAVSDASSAASDAQGNVAKLLNKSKGLSNTATVSCGKSGTKKLTLVSGTDTLTATVDYTDCVTDFNPDTSGATCSSGTTCFGLVQSGQVQVVLKSSTTFSLLNAANFFNGITSADVTYGNSYRSRNASIENGVRTSDYTLTVTNGGTANITSSPSLLAADNARTDTIKLNGTWTLVDNLSSFTQSFIFVDYTTEIKVVTETDADNGTASQFTDNGTVTITYGGVAVKGTFVNYITKYWDKTVNSEKVVKKTEDGKVTTANSCLSDTLTVSTTTPIVDEPDQTCFTAGTIEVSSQNSGSGKVMYKSDGSTEIYVNGSLVETIKCGDAISGCPVSKLQAGGLNSFVKNNTLKGSCLTKAKS